MTSTSWAITMADLPPEFASARIISAPFCGMSMIEACDGYPASFFAVIALESGGQLPIQVSPGAFLLLASIASGPHETVLVLCRRGENELFDMAGLFSHSNAMHVAEGLGRV